MNKLHEKCNNTLLALRGIIDAARDIMPDGSGLPFDEAIITLKTLFKLLELCFMFTDTRNAVMLCCIMQEQ